MKNLMVRNDLVVKQTNMKFTEQFCSYSGIRVTLFWIDFS